MQCRECAHLETKLERLNHFHSLSMAENLKAVRLDHPEIARYYEETLFVCAKEIVRAKKRLANHLQNCPCAASTAVAN